MFDILAQQLVAGRPFTSYIYSEDSDYKPVAPSNIKKNIPIQIRDMETGVVTNHDTIVSALDVYPDLYIKALHSLLRDRRNTWKNLQARPASDTSHWHDHKEKYLGKSAKRARPYVIYAQHKGTGEVKLGLRPEIARLMKLSTTTIFQLCTERSPGKDTYVWSVRYATQEDLAKDTTFRYIPTCMSFYEPS
jgi:hypothetical protein